MTNDDDSQLETMVTKLEAELERERLERNWSESELNSVKTFWEMTKQELQDKKLELLNKAGDAEAAEERHQLEIKVRLSTAYIAKHAHLFYYSTRSYRLQPNIENTIRPVLDIGTGATENP